MKMLYIPALCGLLVSSIAIAQPQLSDAQRQQAAQKLKDADKNGDGLISRDEAAASLPRISKHFDQLDGNGDGQLSPDELRAAVQKLAAARGG